MWAMDSWIGSLEMMKECSKEAGKASFSGGLSD